VMTHAFFKALLFLGAGSVIHALHEEQDIRNMGGLKSHLPITSRTFLLGSIAIAGIFPFSGFFSKDEILWKTFSGGHWVLWLIGLCGAALTAFYMFRLYTLTFDGKQRWSEGKHPHESPATMTVPLIILAVLSVVGGVVGIPHSLGGGNAIDQWLAPVFEPAEMKLATAGHGELSVEYLLMALSVGIALAGIFLARSWYLRKKEIPDQVARKAQGVYTLLLNKYYVDEVYDATVVTPVVKGSERLLWRIIDVGVIDWTVNAVARLVATVSATGRRVQTGIVHSYVIAFLVGVIAILGWLLAH